MVFIGLMSGTSMDGIDAVLVDLSEGAKVLAASHTPYQPELREELLSLARSGTCSLEHLSQVDWRTGMSFAQCALALLQQAGFSPDKVIAIGSHGQTLGHFPHHEHGTTLQIGDPNLIAEHTGITTVADFRRRDMAAGGQGAPLVPAFHAARLRTEHNRWVLNIGGIANLTFLPADHSEPVTGFDTGPGNTLLDYWIETHRGQPYDDKGEWARSGQVNEALLQELLQDSYFSATPPKSTGPDYFSPEWLRNHLQTHTDLAPEDVQATLAELTAHSLAQAIESEGNTEEILVCGGGVHNPHLLDRLQARLPRHRLQSTAEVGIDPDWMEAIAFAWLAQQALSHQAGNLVHVTGAHHPVILGGIYPGRPT